MSDKISVKKSEVEYLATFSCQHSGNLKETCFDYTEQGACCNSCWVRAWAKKQLRLEKVDEAKKD